LESPDVYTLKGLNPKFIWIYQCLPRANNPNQQHLPIQYQIVGKSRRNNDMQVSVHICGLRFSKCKIL